LYTVFVRYFFNLIDLLTYRTAFFVSPDQIARSRKIQKDCTDKYKEARSNLIEKSKIFIGITLLAAPPFITAATMGIPVIVGLVFISTVAMVYLMQYLESLNNTVKPSLSGLFSGREHGSNKLSPKVSKDIDDIQEQGLQMRGQNNADPLFFKEYQEKNQPHFKEKTMASVRI
jgi:hypothetical protein